MTKSTEVAVSNNDNAEITYNTVDFSQPLPDIENAEVAPFDLMADYWTPEKAGESKRVFFDKIDVRMVKDINSDNLIELECAYFLEQKDGEVKTVSNGSKRLVGAIQANGIKRGCPLQITFLGKSKNKSNNFSSDSWSIKPLKINI